MSAQLLEDSMVIMRQLIRLINDSDSQEAQGGRGGGESKVCPYVPTQQTY